jgi:hypothetical protein
MRTHNPKWLAISVISGVVKLMKDRLKWIVLFCFGVEVDNVNNRLWVFNLLFGGYAGLFQRSLPFQRKTLRQKLDVRSHKSA